MLPHGQMQALLNCIRYSVIPKIFEATDAADDGTIQFVVEHLFQTSGSECFHCWQIHGLCRSSQLYL